MMIRNAIEGVTRNKFWGGWGGGGIIIKLTVSFGFIGFSCYNVIIKHKHSVAKVGLSERRVLKGKSKFHGFQKGYEVKFILDIYHIEKTSEGDTKLLD